MTRPFRIDVPESDLDDLRGRLARTRWPTPSPLEPWAQGTDLDYLRELVGYWREEFDWRRQEALLNDTADWEEAKKQPLICATECDSNGALTMQLMHHLTGTPVLFADLRHYHEKEKLYDLTNSGQHAPWFAKRSANFRSNWKHVQLRPALDFYFRAGGASVQFYAATAPKVTFARIVRRRGHYLMHIFTGSFAKLSRQKEEKLAKMTTYEWPHAFARFDPSLATLRDNYSSNHIHAVIGDHVAALLSACELLGIDPVVLS